MTLDLAWQLLRGGAVPAAAAGGGFGVVFMSGAMGIVREVDIRIPVVIQPVIALSRPELTRIGR